MIVREARLPDGTAVEVAGKAAGTVEALVGMLEECGRVRTTPDGTRVVEFDDGRYDAHLRRMIEAVGVRVRVTDELSPEAQDPVRASIWQYVQRNDDGMVYVSLGRVGRLARRLKRPQPWRTQEALGRLPFSGPAYPFFKNLKFWPRAGSGGTDPVVNLSLLEEHMGLQEFEGEYLMVPQVRDEHLTELFELMTALRQQGVFEAP